MKVSNSIIGNYRGKFCVDMFKRSQLRGLFFHIVHGKVALDRSQRMDAGQHCHTLMPSCC